MKNQENINGRGRLLTPKKTTEIYGIPTVKVYNWIRNKRFPFFKPDKGVLFWESDFLEFLERHKVEKFEEF